MGPFSPSHADWSYQLLVKLFGANWDSPFSSAAGGTILDYLMHTLFGIAFTIMCLLYAYTTIAGSYATTHEGVAMGRRFHWAYSPLRGVIGFGMLSPVGASGICILQGVLMLAGASSIYLANRMNDAGIDYLAKHQGSLTVNAAEDPTLLARGLLKTATLSVYLQNYEGLQPGPLMWNPTDAANDSWELVFPMLTSTGNPSGMSDDEMGHVSLDCPPDANVALSGSVNSPAAPNTLCDVRKKAVIDMYRAMLGIASEIIYQNKSPTTLATPPPSGTGYGDSAAVNNADAVPAAAAPGAGNLSSQPDIGAQIANAITNYQATLGSAIVAYSRIENGPLKTSYATFEATAKQNGWATDGAWYLQIMRVNNDVQSSIGDVPVASDPSDKQLTSLWDKEMRSNYENSVAQANLAFDEYTGIAGLITQDTSDGGSKSDPGKTYDWLKEKFTSGVRATYGDMLTALASGQDPIGTIQSAGHAMATASISTLLLVKAGQAATKIPLVGSVLGVALSGILSFAATILDTTIILSAGMSYVIPLTPFVIYTLAVISWFVLFIESWIAMIVWAIAHGMPEGEGFVGTSARQGYMLFFGVTLKPMLLVMGFFASIVAISAVMPFVAKLFTLVFSGNTGGDGLWTILLDFIGYFAAFVIVSFVVIQKLCHLITWVPDNILKWIGNHTPPLGDGAGASSALGGIGKGGSKGISHGRSAANSLTESAPAAVNQVRDWRANNERERQEEFFANAERETIEEHNASPVDQPRPTWPESVIKPATEAAEIEPVAVEEAGLDAGESIQTESEPDFSHYDTESPIEDVRNYSENDTFISPEHLNHDSYNLPDDEGLGAGAQDLNPTDPVDE